MIRFRSWFWLANAVLLVAGCGGGMGANDNNNQHNSTTPTITAWPTASAITFGQTLASSTLTGGTASAAGTFAFTAPSTAPTAGTPAENVTFIPSDTADYTTVAGSVTVTVHPAKPTVTVLPTANAITFGQTLANSTLTGGMASTAGTFVFTSPAMAPGAGMQTESVTFTPADTTDYTNATGSVIVTVNQATPTITWSTPSAMTYGTALSSTQLDATANVAGTISYSPASGTVLTAGSQKLTAMFTPADAADYASAGSSVFLTVNKATPTISALPTASTITVGQTLASSTLTGGSAVFGGNTVAGTFAFTSPVTAPSQGTDSESIIFSPTDTIDYATVNGTVNVTVNPAAPPTVTVDFGTTYQTIRGFGGSTAWLGALTTAQANTLFSPSSGLGLSVLRVRIDPTGSSTSTPHPYATTGVGGWSDELTNAQEEIAANSNAIVFATPWTPPVSLKNSSTNQPYFSGTCGPASGYCGGYLDPSNYAAYTAYLQDFVQYFANNGNSGSRAVNLYAISMQNEPDYADVNYESCNWTAAQMDAWVATLSGPNALGARLIMPESFDFNPNQSGAALSDSNANSKVSIVGEHLYGVNTFTLTSTMIPQLNGRDLWMTEHGFSPTGSQPAIGDALSLAEEIHNALTLGQFNAYVYWWIWDDPDDSINYGLIDSNTTSPAPTYYGYAMGQFSRFIQPGFVRVSATANPVSGVYISAYDYTGGIAYPNNYAIVAINATTNSQNVAFTLNNPPVGNLTSMTPYQTSPSGVLATESPITVTSGQFTYTLPAQSITTFVQ